MTGHCKGALPYPKHDYHEYPKSLPRDAFWAQVRRTVGGKPVPEGQITLIREQVTAKLDLNAQDILLDLACGNGALSSELTCRRLVGVDHSAYLVDVAHEYFHNPPRSKFVLDGAGHYCATTPDAAEFTKVLCYGSLSFFPASEVADVLASLHERFVNVERVFIGNVPDRSRAAEHYASRSAPPDDLDDHETQYGTWWEREQLATLAASFGWEAEVCTMPPEFYAAAYRFDLLLKRGS
jgi:SAM-dependent methyltransferase